MGYGYDAVCAIDVQSGWTAIQGTLLLQTKNPMHPFVAVPRPLLCVHITQTVRAWHHAGYWIVDLKPHNVVIESVGPGVVSARLIDLEAVERAPKKEGVTLTPRMSTRLFRDPREGV